MSLANIEGKLTLEEMENVMAGIAVGEWLVAASLDDSLDCLFCCKL